MSREIRCFDYVNHPYEQVRAALSADAVGVFHAATKSAASRAKSVAAQLRVNVGGIEIGTDIEVVVKGIEDRDPGVAASPLTQIELEWKAAKSPHLFPFMQADLAIYPLTPTETQLDLAGRYVPPLGPLGEALDALAGRRIAEASVHRFLADVAGYLRREL